MTLPEVCVVYLLRPNATVLLGEKLKGLGVGKIVAPGGKLEPGESPEHAAVREVAEEVGITIRSTDLQLIGELTYLFPSKPAWSQKSWAFIARGDWPEPSDSDELVASWVPLTDIPLDRMWDDAKYWLPDALAGRPVVATFTFAEDLSTVTD